MNALLSGVPSAIPVTEKRLVDVQIRQGEDIEEGLRGVFITVFVGGENSLEVDRIMAAFQQVIQHEVGKFGISVEKKGWWEELCGFSFELHFQKEHEDERIEKFFYLESSLIQLTMKVLPPLGFEFKTFRERYRKQKRVGVWMTFLAE